MNDLNNAQLNSPEWVFFVKASFAISFGAMFIAIFFFAQVDLISKGFLAMGTLYLVASTFTLSKTIRDEFEGQKLINNVITSYSIHYTKLYEHTARSRRARRAAQSS